MKIIKFGGTSVSSAEKIIKAEEIIKSYLQQKVALAVVTSAMGGVTNKLIEAGEAAAASNEAYTQKLKDIEDLHVATVKSLIDIRYHSSILARLKMIINELEDLLHGIFLLKELSPRILDVVQSFGERLSAYIITEYLKQENINAEYLDARQLIITDTTFGKARPDFEVTNANIVQYFNSHTALQVITGFISATPKGHTTTLGRGGSDYTAAIFGAALNAEEIVKWTDVDGVMTADPKIVKDAFSLPSISYIEAMELSHFGAQVIYPPTLQPAFGKKIPLRIRNTFNPTFEGTCISEKAGNEDLSIKGISSIANISLISISGSGMVGIPGFAAKLFGALAKANINIILITQASSEHSICFAVSPNQSLSARQIIEEEFDREIDAGKVDKIKVENDLSILAIVGENMKSTFGIAGKLFVTFTKNGINVSAIAQGSSEFNLSVVIKKSDLSKALNAVHQAFFLSNIRKLNLFIVGTGLIGNTLLRQIQRQIQYLLKDRLLQINIIGLANSRNFYFDEKGIDLNTWKEKVDFPGKNTKMKEFVAKMKSLNLANSVFVDCTSSNEVIQYYKDILKSSISIVTPNKLANSNSFADYEVLQKTAFENGVRFMYETNVGAGLPVINTLRDLKFSGDKIVKIEGVLSGTLSYIFNSFDGDKPFSAVVKEAKEKGYTEPDPRDDLNGKDVARKILILAREAGVELEPDDVQVTNILPDYCMQAENVDQFFSALEKADPYLDALLEGTKRNKKVLRFIASAEDGKAIVSLQAIDQKHPFYSLSGSDNIISFTTERYKERPLVIKGPGAGAEVTAAGVFAEIISIGNYMA